jgi:parvulin-like peptidyl-prolyl isomerase
MDAYGRSKGIQVVDLGPRSESDLVRQFGLKAQDLRTLGKGEISLPVRSGDRSFIFQVVGRTEGKALDRSEAEKAIRARVTLEKAKLLAMMRAEDALKDKTHKFSGQTPFLSRTSAAIPGIGQLPPDGAGVLQLSKGQVFPKPVEIGGKYYVFAYLDEKQPGNDVWLKEKDAFTRVFGARMASAFIEAFKEDLKKSIKVRVYRDEV